MNDPTSNPFGFVDHTAFAGFNVDLVWGLDGDGAAVHISAARRGLACGLVCPACNTTLIAHKGLKLAAHFKHQGKGSGCGSGRETNAHYWAKQLLVEQKRIRTPDVIATVGRTARLESKARWMHFDDVRSEHRLGAIVPDIVLVLADRRELIVEICVTHPCGDDKIALLKSNVWPAIEINLRHLRSCQDIALVERALLEDAPRTWLSNPRRQRAEEALRQELAEATARRAKVERDRAAREAEKLRREAQEIEAAALELVRVAAAVRASAPPLDDPDLVRLIEADRGRLIGIAPAGDGFLVSTEEWQAVLVERHIIVDDVRTFEEESFSLGSALAYLEPAIAEPFLRDPSEKVWRWLQQHRPAFCFPREAVKKYLDALCIAGALQSEGSGSYGLPGDRIKALKRERSRAIDIDRRAAAAYDLLDQIVADLPVEEAFDFDARLRLAAPLEHFGLSPDEIIAQGGDAYPGLIARLRALAKMSAGGEDVADTLPGLPLAAARHRAIARRTARRCREAAERTRRLREAATRALSVEAEAWLAMALNDGGETPIGLASLGQAGLDRSLDSLDAIVQRREMEKAEAAAIASRRETLRQAVNTLFAQNVRELALHNYAPALGCSPWEACGTVHGLESAIRILTEQARNRGRRR